MDQRPSKLEAEKAIKTILQYLGEDPSREGLLETPKRVVESYSELFAGYNIKPEDVLDKQFFETANFRDVILLKDIDFKSLCEHHMLPMYGKVDIAYIPDKSILGISKLARLVDVFAKRLQIQERMTVEIAESIFKYVQPLGVAVKVTALHSCMTMRGVAKNGSNMATVHFCGSYKESKDLRSEFLSLTK